MSLEERLEKAEKLVAEVKAELAAMRVTKRNWPERIEAGDCFEQANGSRYLVCGTKLVSLDTGALWLLGGGPSGNDKTDLSYLGKIDLTIRTDAHEPTGAELVGRVCEVMGVKAGRPATAWSPTLGVTWADDDMIQSGAAAWHKDARLAK